MHRPKSALLWIGIAMLTWCVVLAVPQFRSLLFIQTVQVPRLLPKYQPNFGRLTRTNPHNLPLRIADFTQVQYNRYQIYPDIVTGHEKEMGDEINQLIKDFPQSPIPVYVKLIYLLHTMEPVRNSGWIDSREAYDQYKTGVFPSDQRREKQYTHEQWLQAIALCKKGQRIAPNNGMFDLMEAYWQFAEFHQEAGLNAIDRALRKPVIDDYSLKIRQITLAAFQTAYHQDLMWFEYSRYSYDVAMSEFLQNGLFQWSHLWDWMVWSGMKEQINGKDSAALKTYNIAFRAARHWVESTKKTGSYFLVVYLELTALSGPGNIKIGPYPEQANTVEKFDNWSDRWISIFKQYALTHNRPDLAKYAQVYRNHKAQEAAINNAFIKDEASHSTQKFAGMILLWIGVAMVWLIAVVIIIHVLIGAARAKKEHDIRALLRHFAHSGIRWIAMISLLYLLMLSITALVIAPLNQHETTRLRQGNAVFFHVYADE